MRLAVVVLALLLVGCESPGAPTRKEELHEYYYGYLSTGGEDFRLVLIDTQTGAVKATYKRATYFPLAAGYSKGLFQGTAVSPSPRVLCHNRNDMSAAKHSILQRQHRRRPHPRNSPPPCI
jgi:hypothetical protein